jgi:hypothetical protein
LQEALKAVCTENLVRFELTTESLIFFLLNLCASIFKPKSRLEAENAALRQQLLVLQRKVKLANDGQDTRAIQHYLGHRSIASTVRYTALAPDRFKHFWKD